MGCWVDFINVFIYDFPLLPSTQNRKCQNKKNLHPTGYRLPFPLISAKTLNSRLSRVRKHNKKISPHYFLRGENFLLLALYKQENFRVIFLIRGKATQNNICSYARFYFIFRSSFQGSLLHLLSLDYYCILLKVYILH